MTEEEFQEKIKRKRLERMFSTDRTDEMLKITHTRGWIIGVVLVVLLIGLLICYFFGWIQYET